jgi:hypothetical protein
MPRRDDLPVGGPLIAAALNEDIANEAFLIYGAPKPRFLAGDGDDDFIEGCLSPRRRAHRGMRWGEFPAEIQAPLSERFVCGRDIARCQHFFNHAQAQREPEIEPDRVAEKLGRIAIAG